MCEAIVCDSRSGRVPKKRTNGVGDLARLNGNQPLLEPLAAEGVGWSRLLMLIGASPRVEARARRSSPR